ncbi:hypothetical protein PVAG01_00521 [Phlyctema vagabunda]|uniref:Mso1 N-terminal domain-containing protein n=1 Tax=Phlyctema vagabunda TaxID=108571 RepID=A0ABR4PV30_9HELO
MTSYLSSLLTTTTSRVASIRQNLLPTEDDGATEDDTHVCRVLRAYYTEKGRRFPAWLPPDPKAPPPVVVQPVYSTPGVGSQYGGGMQNQPQSGLSSLWDKSGAGNPPRQQQQQAGSLRQGHGLQPANSPFQRQEVQARPLPSQREGSYQAASPFARETAAPAAGTASNRLKDRLRAGGRSASPANSFTGAVREVQRTNSYESNGGSATYDNSYEDSFRPRENASKPFVAATSPWANNESEFSGTSYGGGNARVGGLPSGPAAGRRGQGLPSGPRGMR